ncbi:hypothetical protein [Pseudomonas sp. CFBP 13719]|uniref:hypothetical protein n=1 Tax=Pseudomonas sp. CFBP 13719 TaxID=2775303 RepID=UPI00178213DA|nr:hypothetical protein [Pseudomonas sp. CFBP 13719]MBD8685024.1 hypothetical protein [Pseudomonas sp. CFBP 13719]
MKRSILILLAALLPSIALANCPEGFVRIGTMEKESNGQFGREAKVPAELAQVNLPPRFVVDTNYQQGDFQAAGGDARPVMNAGDIPPGFFLKAKGSESPNCAGWSIQKPETKVLQRNGNVILQEALAIRLYCHSGSGEICKSGSGCNVSVEVCAKQGK